ncbi:MAG: TolC family protein [Flavobacteriaceae bacterium]|nr:TolC family protein [Flavobacteriaceae bacterium]MCF8425730.1 TolC family protein [Bacteroidia bacterium]MCF8446398.1 TolC family protein [Bacteroidia bacterium]
MNSKNGILFCLLILSFQIGHSQQSQPQSFSIKEAVEYAKKNNYSLQNNKLDVISSQKKVNEILSNGLPQISASANVINNVQIPVQVIPNFTGQGPEFLELKFGRPFTSNITVSANQLLFDGTFFLGVKASKEFVNLAKLNFSRNEIETEVNVSKAYYLVLLLEANEKMMLKNIESLEKTKSDVTQFYKNGFSEKIDVDRLALQLSNLTLQKDKIHDQKEVSKMVLKLQMGMLVSDSIILTDDLDNLYDASKLSAIDDKVSYLNRVEYKMLQQQLSLNYLDKKRYSAGYFPSIFAFANHVENAFGDQFSGLYNQLYPGTSIGLSATIPIFDGLKKNAQTQQAKIGIAKTENDIKNFENLLNQQVYQAKASYLRSSQQLEIQKGNLKLAQEIYEKIDLKYKNGVSSSLELTTAQTDLENARTNYLTTVYEYFVAEMELKKALGLIK